VKSRDDKKKGKGNSERKGRKVTANAKVRRVDGEGTVSVGV